MSTIEKLQKKFDVSVYPSVYDEQSDIYKLLNALASEIDDYINACNNMKDMLFVSTSTSPILKALASGYGVEQFSGEEDDILKIKFKAIRGIPVMSINNMKKIIQMYCSSEPIIDEVAPNEIEVTIPQGSTYPAYYLLTIGTDGSYGSAIGDSDKLSAGAIYSNVNSSIIVTLSYLEYIINLIKPAGKNVTIIEGGV